jgi:hypothetical protein
LIEDTESDKFQKKYLTTICSKRSLEQTGVTGMENLAGSVKTPLSAAVTSAFGATPKLDNEDKHRIFCILNQSSMSECLLCNFSANESKI